MVSFLKTSPLAQLCPEYSGRVEILSRAFSMNEVPPLASRRFFFPENSCLELLCLQLNISVTPSAAAVFGGGGSGLVLLWFIGGREGIKGPASHFCPLGPIEIEAVRFVEYSVFKQFGHQPLSPPVPLWGLGSFSITPHWGSKAFCLPTLQFWGGLHLLLFVGVPYSPLSHFQIPFQGIADILSQPLAQQRRINVRLGEF